MKMNKVILVALLFIGLATTTKANSIVDVLVHQRTSIENGYRFGKINHYDVQNLRLEQVRIEQVILKAKRDGVITVRERSKILRLQDLADRNIWLAASISNGLNRNTNNYNGGQACLPSPARQQKQLRPNPVKPKRTAKRSARKY